MVAIGDEAGLEFIAGELFPEGIVVSWDESSAAVAEMGAETRAGGDGIADDGRRGGGMGNGRDDLVFDQGFDQGQRTGEFGGEGEEFDAAASGVLPALDEIPVGSLDMLAGMSAAGAVVR